MVEPKVKEIIMTQSGIRIKPYVRKQSKFLESITGLYDPAIHRVKPTTGFYVAPKTFATYAMKPSFLKPMFPDYQIRMADRIDIWDILEFHFLESIDFTELQKTIIDASVQTKCPRQYIKMQTGRGKTYVGIYLISNARSKALILGYALKILTQWAGSLDGATTFDMKRVLKLTGSKILLKIINGQIDVSNYDIFLATPQLIESFADQYGWDAVTDLFEKMHLGVKIYDEAHRNIKAMVHIDAFTNVAQTYYLSAEFQQSSKEKSKLFWNMFHDVPVLSATLDMEDDLRYVVVGCVEYDTHPTMSDQASVYTNRGFSNFAYMKYQVQHSAMFAALRQLVSDIDQNNPSQYRTLILTSMIDHVDMIYAYLKEIFPDKKIGFYHGKASETDKNYAVYEADLIISTYSSFGVGVDVKRIQFVISCDQVDMITDNQAAGRARPIDGRNAFYFMLFDTGFPRSESSKKRRTQYLKESKAVAFYSIWIGET